MKWIAGVGLIALIVGAAATITIPAATVAPDMEILKLFPPETQGIASVDAAALRNAALVQDILKEGHPPLPPEVLEFSEKTGLVFERDIDHVTMGKIGAKQVMIIVRARYDRIKVEQFLRDKNVSSEAYQGWPIYRPGNGHGEPPVIALVDNLVLFGHEAPVRGAIERKAAPGPSVADNNDVMQAINKIEAGNQIWAAGRFTADDLPIPRNRPAQADALLKELQGGTTQIRIDQDVHVRAAGDFSNAETAGKVVDMLRGFLGLAKLQLAQEPDLNRLLDAVRLDVLGSSAVVNFDAPGDIIKKFHPPFEKKGN